MTIRYAQINQAEIKELATKKASGLATQIYLVLSSHCWKKNECFPSMDRIANLLGGVYHKGSIFRALKWLEDHGFIVRKAAKSTSRFVMKVRSITKSLCSSQKREHKKRKEKSKNNLRYSNQEKYKKSQSNQSQRPETGLDRGTNWLNKALDYVFGETDKFESRCTVKDINIALGGGHAASMFWDKIQDRCSHLMVRA